MIDMLSYAEQVWREWSSYNVSERETAIKTLSEAFYTKEIVAITGPEARTIIAGLKLVEPGGGLLGLRFDPKTLGAIRILSDAYKASNTVRAFFVQTIVSNGTDLNTLARLSGIDIKLLREVIKND